MPTLRRKRLLKALAARRERRERTLGVAVAEWRRLVLRGSRVPTPEEEGLFLPSFAGGVLQSLVYVLVGVLTFDTEREATVGDIVLAFVIFSPLALGWMWLCSYFVGADLRRSCNHSRRGRVRCTILFALISGASIPVFFAFLGLILWSMDALTSRNPERIPEDLLWLLSFGAVSLPGPALTGWLLFRSQATGRNAKAVRSPSVVQSPPEPPS